jgi:hypothetical protein
MATGINWDRVRVELDAQDWEEDHDNPGSQVRTLYLGSVLSIYPSGKYYLPFACSNLDPCPACNGSGNVKLRQSNREKGKAAARLRRHSRKLRRLYGKTRPAFARGPRQDNSARKYLAGRKGLLSVNTISERARGLAQCVNCQGMGSREAYLDSVFSEELEAEAEAAGVWLMSGEGDGLDVLVGEQRDVPDCDECGEPMSVNYVGGWECENDSCGECAPIIPD